MFLFSGTVCRKNRTEFWISAISSGKDFNWDIKITFNAILNRELSFHTHIDNIRQNFWKWPSLSALWELSHPLPPLFLIICCVSYKFQQNIEKWRKPYLAFFNLQKKTCLQAKSGIFHRYWYKSVLTRQSGPVVTHRVSNLLYFPDSFSHSMSCSSIVLDAF